MTIRQCTILKNTSISPELFVLEFPFEGQIKAGQFVMVNIPDSSKILPRPISVFDYDETTKTLSLLIRKRGKGTEILSQLKEGDSISVFGSMGQGFPTQLKEQNILFMGGGEGIAPALLVSKTLSSNNNVTVFGGFRYEVEAGVLDYFDVPTEYTAQDHSNQCQRGLITDLLQDITPPDYIFCCGPIPMMKAIYDYTKNKQWPTKVYVSMESHMACGVGACMGCTVKSPQEKALKICSEGPVFLAEEVFNA